MQKLTELFLAEIGIMHHSLSEDRYKVSDNFPTFPQYSHTHTSKDVSANNSGVRFGGRSGRSSRSGFGSARCKVYEKLIEAAAFHQHVIQ